MSEDPTDPIDFNARRKRKIKLLHGQDALRPKDPGTVVRGLLHKGSLSLVYGPPKSGKSFWLTSLLIAVSAADKEWMGHRIVKPGAVLYVACEGWSGFWKRLSASQSRRGDFPDGFTLADDRPQLLALSAKNVAHPKSDELLEALDTCRALYGSYPVALAIDTVFRSFGGGNVNDSSHMNAYIAALNPILDAGVAVALVHHETKAGGTPAGSITLTGASDTIIRVRNGDGAKHTWEIESAKDDATGPARGFRLESVELGRDADGEAINSCVMVDEGEKSRTGGRPKKLAERDRAFELLCEVLIDRGQPAPAGFPIERAVLVQHWRELFKTRCRPDDSADTKLKAFKACVKDLQDQRRVGVRDLWCWPLHDPGNNP
jgi:hypothetical protein